MVAPGWSWAVSEWRHQRAQHHGVGASRRERATIFTMNVLVESTLNLMRCAKKNYMSMRQSSMLAVAHAHRATERNCGVCDTDMR